MTMSVIAGVARGTPSLRLWVGLVPGSPSLQPGLMARLGGADTRGRDGGGQNFQLNTTRAYGRSRGMGNGVRHSGGGAGPRLVAASPGSEWGRLLVSRLGAQSYEPGPQTALVEGGCSRRGFVELFPGQRFERNGIH
jgi:hypothetical protein